MLYIIKNYKKIIENTIINKFEGSNDHWIIEKNSEQKIIKDKKDNKSKLYENFQKLVKDWKINEKDLQTIKNIKEEMEKLQKTTKEKIKTYFSDIVSPILKNWYKISTPNWLDTLKRIAELTNNNELINKLKKANIKNLEWKTIVQENNKFIIYDKEDHREWYLTDNWTIDIDKKID